MRFFSTAKNSPLADLRTAVMSGLAPDGGLYMPETIPALSPGLIASLRGCSFKEVAFTVASAFFAGDISAIDLERIIREAFPFDAPLKQLTEKIHVLELFHGPTLAFKDFGARFMARLLAYLTADEDKRLVILTATSGDTGSAVAHGFFGVPGIDAVILYPSGKISPIQEKQLTTLGGNITALEVAGNFDDCQRLVKEAFLDSGLTKQIRITSANSINIARLIPQSFYYFYGYTQLPESPDPFVYSVPSGNFGNLTAGLLARRMGLPVARFIAATNVNAVVPEYLESGTYHPRPSVPTLSSAMDVGNPSNFSRMLCLYDQQVERMRADISGYSFNDDQTRGAIRRVFESSNYILDPHGAVGYLGLEEYLSREHAARGIFLETAHPAKFPETVQEIAGDRLVAPPRLQACFEKEKVAIPIGAAVAELKDFLLARFGS